MQCPHCDSQNTDERLFCAECGKSLSLICGLCRFSNQGQAKFCGGCGAPLVTVARGKLDGLRSYTPQHLADKILSVKSTIEGERKPVTVLFCDLVGSTGIAGRVGADVMHSLLSKFFELALSEVHRYEGVINQFLGDGFMALFGAPLSHEDHARRGILAALGLQRALALHREGFTQSHGVELAVRMGLNTGQVVVGAIGDNLRMDYTAIGDTTNLAAQMQQLAKAGSICITENTRRLVMGFFDIKSLGDRAVKGRIEHVPIYQVLAASREAQPSRNVSAGGIASPFVGREQELNAFMSSIDRLLTGQGGVVSLVGEAGVGKSRFVAEACKRIRDANICWLEGRTLSYSQLLGYWPFLRILKSYVGISEEDDDAESWNKLVRKIVALFPDQVAEILPYLATLLSLQVKGELEQRVKYLSGEGMGRQMLLTSKRFFARVAQDRPLVLLFEDVHWIDQSSAELIEHLLPLVETVPLLICCVSRPVVNSLEAHLRDVMSREYADRYRQITLSALTQNESSELTSNLLGLKTLPLGLGDLILNKTEGNPFFIEEVIRTLIGMKVLVRETTSNRWEMRQEVEHIYVPDTIEGVIMARIDRLDNNLKEVLKHAAVIGRSFLYEILHALIDSGGQLDSWLVDLQQIELIREKSRAPELEFIFKHALAQQAIYESILVERRKELHRAVGRCIETIFAQRLGEFSGVLAYHYAKGEDWSKAQEFLLKAGDQAGQIAANAEALSHYRRAMDACTRAFGDKWDQTERAVLTRKIGEAFFRRGDHGHACEYLERALGLWGHVHPTSFPGIRNHISKETLIQVAHRLLPTVSEQAPSRVNAAEEVSTIYDRLAWIDYFRHPERCLLDGLKQLNYSERDNFPLGVVRGASVVGMVLDLIPLPSLARRYHSKSLKLAEALQHRLAIAHSYLGYGAHNLTIGLWDEGISCAAKSADAYREAGELRGWGGATQILAWLLRLKGDYGRSVALSQEVLSVGQDGKDSIIVGWALQGLGRAFWHAGLTERGIPLLSKAIECFREAPDYPSLACATSDLGMCYLRQGRIEEALATLEMSMQMIRGRHLRGFLSTQAFLGLAEGYLFRASLSEGIARVHTLRKAKAACRAAGRHAARVSEGRPGYYRLQANYLWMKGQCRVAETLWTRSIGLSEETGNLYEWATTRLDSGRFLQNSPELEQGQALRKQIELQVEAACNSTALLSSL